METLFNVLGYGILFGVLFVVFYLFAKLLSTAFHALTHNDD
jgi:ABC-type thiamin/hydroxymethylpyrimidine transport system permease subunit